MAMNFKAVAITAICAFIGVAQTASPTVIDQGNGVCVLQEVETIFPELVVVVNEFFESNTIINIGGITIDVNNAPQTVSTVITVTSTTTTTAPA